MKLSRRSSNSSLYQVRSAPVRLHGRVTKEDIRSASLRRWDGRARVTTDWVNLYHEPELCYPDGDLLIYLREPGQSSRGPAFRVHKITLEEKGFDFLLDKCIDRPLMHLGTNCMSSSCHGCPQHTPPSELYIPAPANSDLDATFDHHVSTRNFFAWLYGVPLAGRALGRSLMNLKERIDYYRPDSDARTTLEVVSFAEAQRYLDFRECVDHALAALFLAESLQIEDLWIDAFAHCVGMSYRGLNTSLEYWAVSYETRLLMSEAQQELEVRLSSIRKSVRDFFEYDVSQHFLGLSQSARDHLDRFRSWLQTFHIKQHGFWPPTGLDKPTVEHTIYATMYTNFKNLYQHLVNPDSSPGMTDLYVSGGVCVTQNIQAFDSRHQYESLPKTMPLSPLEPMIDTTISSLQKRKPWNPVTRRRIDKDKKKVLRIQALITASNRDWAIMECPLVRQYSEFETQSIMDESDNISMVEGRKVRWFVIYAILQTIGSIMQTPAQVRNGDGLTYWLCCRIPNLLPWQTSLSPSRIPTLPLRRSRIEPDTQYTHRNTPDDAVSNKSSRPMSKYMKEYRRMSLPGHISTTPGRPASIHSMSFKKLINRRSSLKDDVPPVPKSPGFCEILIQGYGNGLNEVECESAQTENFLGLKDEEISEETSPVDMITAMNDSQIFGEPSPDLSDSLPDLTPDLSPELTPDLTPDLTPFSAGSISRESSKASISSTSSKSPSVDHTNADVRPVTSIQDDSLLSFPDLAKMVSFDYPSQDPKERPLSTSLNQVLDEDGFMRTVHFNTKTWDELLGI